MKLNEALGILELGAEPTPAEVKDAYYRLARTHHPDRGGNPDDFQRAHEAYRVALADASRAHTCETCEGRGSVPRSSGFHTAHVRCADCQGRGTYRRGS